MLAAVVGACGDVDDGAAVVATVDGLEMTEDDVLRSYVDYLVTTGQNDTEANRRRHVEALVDAYLLGAEAERLGIGEDSAFQAASRLARRRLIGSRYYETAVLDTLAAPTEAEARIAYALGQEQRVVRHLYFTSERATDAAYARLEDGGSFLEEAQALYDTDDPSAGSLGSVSYWQLDDAFAEAAFSTPVGSYSEPVRTRLGWHIILVEDRVRNPVLTEDEFVRRRQGVESQLRLRRRRLEGDSFVRRFMEDRNVSVNRPALLALQEAIRDLEGDPLPDAQQGDDSFTPGEQAEILGAFRPDTPLATFDLDGQTGTFTLADYVFWLDGLPAEEARTRVGASLGRALRNEALARAGEAAGIEDDPDVRHELARRERLRLADELRRRLRETSPASADTVQLARVAQDLGIQPRQTLVDFWTVSFSTRRDAEAALPSLRANPSRAAGLPGYRRAMGESLSSLGSLAAAARSAPLGQAVLASAGDEWVVLEVEDRRTESSGSGADVLARFAAEADLVRRLRETRPIKVDEDVMRMVTSPAPVPRGRR